MHTGGPILLWMTHHHAWILMPALLLVLTGCLPSEQAAVRGNFRANDTPGKVPAIVNAAENDGEDDLAELIHALSDKDPAVRLFAIRSLEQRSGQTFGYRYYEQPQKRQPAVDRWHVWLKDQDAPQIARPTNEESTD